MFLDVFSRVFPYGDLCVDVCEESDWIFFMALKLSVAEQSIVFHECVKYVWQAISRSMFEFANGFGRFTLASNVDFFGFFSRYKSLNFIA